MKHAVIPVVLLFAMLPFAYAQNPDPTPVANPTVISVPLESPEVFLGSIPGEVKPQHLQPQKSFKQQIEDFDEHQRERHERRRHHLQQQFQALHRAGGWQKAYLSQIQAVEAQFPQASDQMASLEKLILNWVFCQTPMIFSVDSDFAAPFDPVFPNNFTPGVDRRSVVEPQADVVIYGCTFGAQAGSVQLVLGSQIEGSGQTLTMNVTDWDSNEIEANLPKTPGIADQPATLVITATNGQQTSYPVQFYQNRVLQDFYVANPPSYLSVSSTAQTTTDDFKALNFSYGDTSPAASHYTFCCSTVSGTDKWFFKLANGWQIPATNGYLVTGYNAELPEVPQDFVQILTGDYDQFTNCGLFSSDPGYLSSMLPVTPPANSGFQAEVDVAWTAGSNCSGVAYALRILMFGPSGIPFE